MSDLWTDQTVALLRAHWREQSVLTIALAISAATGARCTRNAVIGKARRLGLGLHPTSAMQRHYELLASPRLPKVPRRKPEPAKPKSAAERAPSFVSLDPPLVSWKHWGEGFPSTSQAKRLGDLKPSNCRFPVGHESGEHQLFCAAPAKTGSPYCMHHHRITYARTNQAGTSAFEPYVMKRAPATKEDTTPELDFGLAR